ncbi:uncharacterized protein LOC110030525 [Phalaenopsis equestris]|uniref:uncharacterized protein LOC110030525 n=1 Tax=Phalaenopsis equestris TaxID=78828 RepID=UPI0009E5273A|nr:uncharacterized protein LOC110030525 [Phalaenopsis equestris]
MPAVELHSAETFSFHNHITNECRSKPIMDSVLNRAYIMFQVVHDNSKPPKYAEKTNMFNNRRIRIRHALDGVRLQARERIRSIDGISSSVDQMIEKASMNELIQPLEWHKGDINKWASDFSKLEWNQFKRPQVRVVGLLIEAAIFDDLREEVVLDMFVLN